MISYLTIGRVHRERAGPAESQSRGPGGHPTQTGGISYGFRRHDMALDRYLDTAVRSAERRQRIACSVEDLLERRFADSARQRGAVDLGPDEVVDRPEPYDSCCEERFRALRTT